MTNTHIKPSKSNPEDSKEKKDKYKEIYEKIITSKHPSDYISDFLIEDLMAMKHDANPKNSGRNEEFKKNIKNAIIAKLEQLDQELTKQQILASILKTNLVFSILNKPSNLPHEPELVINQEVHDISNYIAALNEAYKKETDRIAPYITSTKARTDYEMLKENSRIEAIDNFIRNPHWFPKPPPPPPPLPCQGLPWPEYLLCILTK